jgi:hypothetical protein
VFPQYYQRFETSVRVTPENRDNPTNKYLIELDIRWKEPDRSFSLGFGTVVVRYGAK